MKYSPSTPLIKSQRKTPVMNKDNKSTKKIQTPIQDTLNQSK